MHVGLDFDGVVADCGRLKSEAAQSLYGLNIPAQLFKKEIILGQGLLTEAQYRALQHAIYGTRAMGLRMRPVPGAWNGIARLRAQGHTVRVVTSRDGAELAVAMEWAALSRIDVDFTGVGYGVSKAAACAGLDVYVDDDLEKLEPLHGVVPHRFLFSWGYNAHIDVGAVATRVASWPAFCAAVDRAASRVTPRPSATRSGHTPAR